MDTSISDKSKIIFITWQPYCSRSDNIAREFIGESFKIYFETFGSNYYTIIFKYALQFLKTIKILMIKQPEIVFVMNPPVFACVPVYLYCKLKRKKYIIDIHTGAIVDQIWRPAKIFQIFFSREALLNLITNDGLIEHLNRWGCKNYLIVPDVPIRVPEIKRPKLNGKYNVTLVNTFSKDEPIENFLSAAIRLKDVTFYITGKIKSNTKANVANLPSHIKFTDYLPDDEYFGYLSASDLIVALTTRDNTMQRGAYEAIYLGKPVVTSNWKVLQDNFKIGSIFVDNSVNGIEEGIKSCIHNLAQKKQEALKLRQAKYDIWHKKYVLIKEAIDE